MAKFTSPLHRDDAEGTDDRGRLHGASAVQRLLNDIPTGPDWNHGKPVNSWESAEAAVEQASQETKDAALRHLLALHMYNLTDKHPQVAMRNLRVGDVVELHGLPRQVSEKIGDGAAGRTVNVRTIAPGRPEAGVAVFANGGDVRVPLTHRVGAVETGRLFERIVDATEGITNIWPRERAAGQRQYRNGLVDAFLALTGANKEELYGQINQAVQTRQDERIAAERG